MNKNRTFSAYQTNIDAWIQSHGGYWPPLSMLSALMEELGELAREINHKEGIKLKKNTTEKSNLGEELADIVFAVICIANYYKVDLSTELNRVIKKYSERDSKRFL